MKGNEVEENLLLCHPLLEHTRGEDIFNATDCFSEKRTLIGLTVVDCALMQASLCHIFTPVFAVMS